MREIGVGVADALDDRERAFVPEALELGEFGVETDAAIERERVGTGDRELSVHAVVVAVVVLDDRVETVVATEHADDDEDPVVGPDRSCSPGGRIVAGQQQLIEQRARPSRQRAGADAQTDELQEAPSVDRMRVGLGDPQVGERLCSGDVRVEHGDLRRGGTRG